MFMCVVKTGFRKRVSCTNIFLKNSAFGEGLEGIFSIIGTPVIFNISIFLKQIPKLIMSKTDIWCQGLNIFPRIIFLYFADLKYFKIWKCTLKSRKTFS